MKSKEIESCKELLEISQANNPNGRRRLKLVLHEIHNDVNKYNYNGISYKEEYVINNAESIIGMPLCAEFLDDEKDIPYGHGLTGMIGNMPVFEESVQVGCFDKWSIEDIEIQGETRRCLCAEGYVNESRYPNFVKWLEDEVENGKTIMGSVEFVGKKENNGNIIYEDGWKEKGRVPMIYDYSGHAILSLKPSDSAAVLLELNQFKNMEDNKKMEKVLGLLENQNAEISKIKTMLETNKSLADCDATIAELNAKIEEMTATINELNTCVANKDAEIAELHSKCEKAEADVEKVKGELNATIESVEAELNQLKKDNKIAELNTALSVFTDEQKAYASEEIKQFNENPLEFEINTIVDKIDSVSYKKIRETQAKHEQNQAKDDFGVIVSVIDPVVNNANGEVEDFNCFA